MSNVASEWKIGNTTFNAIELDEEISLLSDVGKFIGEKGVFLNQEIETSRLKLLTYSENVNLLRKEIYSNNKLKLERYDNRIQYIEPESSNAVKTPPNVGANQIELNFITSNPYKYSKTENASIINLNESNTELFIYLRGQFETPLEFAIESYNMNLTTQSFSSTNVSIPILGTTTYIGNDNLTFSKLTNIPDAMWFEKEGMILPSFGNESGWIWRNYDVGTKLNKEDGKYIWHSRAFKIKSPLKYNADYFKFSYPNINANVTLQTHMERFRIHIWNIDTGEDTPYASPTFYIWNNNESAWNEIGPPTFRNYYNEFSLSPASNYLVDNRLHFIIGNEYSLPFSESCDYVTIQLDMLEIAYPNNEIVSLSDLSHADYGAVTTFYIEGDNNFNGNVDVTIHPASIISQSNRSFQPSIILHSETLDGSTFQGEHEIKTPLYNYDTVAIKLNSNYSGHSPYVKIYNSSKSGEGLIFYKKRLDNVISSNISYDFNTFIKKVDYYTPAKSLKIKNYLNQNSELIFKNPFLGKVYHYNTSDYYIFNPFNNLSNAIMYSNANVNISNDKIYLNQSGITTLEICSLVPFSGIPEGNWSGTGNLSAYITLNETSDFDSWNNIGFHNSTFYFSMYNSDCDIIGKNYFFLRLNSNMSAVVSDLNIKSPITFSGRGFPYLHPNITNPIYISGDNLNSSVIFDYSWREAYL